MATQTVTQAEREVVPFLANRPTPEEIIAFHPSTQSGDRFYELQEMERRGKLTDSEQEELDSFMYLEHLVRLLKAEARRRIEKQAS